MKVAIGVATATRTGHLYKADGARSQLRLYCWPAWPTSFIGVAKFFWQLATPIRRSGPRTKLLYRGGQICGQSLATLLKKIGPEPKYFYKGGQPSHPYRCSSARAQTCVMGWPKFLLGDQFYEYACALSFDGRQGKVWGAHHFWEPRSYVHYGLKS